MRMTSSFNYAVLDHYIDKLQQLDLKEQIIWREFRTIRHINFHCLFWDGSEEGLID
jgi:hypothetical protein